MANKKINQLVLKTTIQSTDLFPLGDATTGQLFKKTIAELQAAIGGAVISVNGLVGTVVLDTDDIQELGGATNRYFTDARARGAISLTVSGNSGASTYNNSTGVLNVPTYTLAGLGGITASFLSGASGIAYNSSTGVITYTGTVFTDASIRALVSAGAGLSYNSSTGVFSYSGTVYTDASIRALISLTTSGTSGVSTYNNTTGVLNVPTYTLAGLGGIGAGFLSGGAGITYNSSTGVIASTITQYTDSLARASISAGTGISYNSGTGVISYSGTVYTDASVRGLLSGTAPITYNSTTGVIGITQASGSTNGFLSSTDWNTFNNKQNTLTLGNVTEVASNVLMFPDGGTNKTIGNLSIQVVQAGASTNGFLSSTDWTTFNNKQATVTLTTIGTSGASTFSAGTLNIPQYAAALSGTTNYVAKFTSSSAIGNSLIFDNGTNVGIGTATPQRTFDVISSSNNIPAASFGRAIPIGNFSGIHFGYIETGNSNYRKSAIVFERTGASAEGKIHILNNNQPDIGSATLSDARFTITSAGNVGIGTTSPAFQLDLGGSGTTNQRLRLQRGSDDSSMNALYGWNSITVERTSVLITDPQNDFSIIQKASNGSRTPFYISSAGTVGIGTTNPGNILDVQTSSGLGSSLASGLARFISAGTTPVISIGQANSARRLDIFSANILVTGEQFNLGTNSANPVLIDVNNIERFRANSNGNFGFNTSSPSRHYTFSNPNNRGAGGFEINCADNLITFLSYDRSTNAYLNLSLSEGSSNVLIGTSTDNGERLYVSGSIRATGSITANSDARLKKNIERIENALEKVGQISGYTYNTIYDEDRHAGVIAQEIDKVLPEIVNKGNDGLMGVEYGNISALLIEAIKDLKKDNESLRAIVEGLRK